MIPRRNLLILSVLVILPWTSHAFVIASDRDGRPLRWNEPSNLRFVLYLPDHVSAALPPNEDIVAAMERAAAAWTDIEGSAVSLVIDRAVAGSPRPRPGFDRDNPEQNVNAILFETEEWRHEPGAFAVTLRTYGSRTGTLLHADIVVNAVEYRWAVLEARSRPDPDGAGPVDVQGVMTHELGHALGFEHTSTSPSAMRSTVGFGEIWMRELSESDHQGLRTLYPAAGPGQPAAPDPEVILAESLVLTGCSSTETESRPSPSSIPTLLFPLGAVAALSLRRRVPSC